MSSSSAGLSGDARGRRCGAGRAVIGGRGGGALRAALIGLIDGCVSGKLASLSRENQNLV